MKITYNIKPTTKLCVSITSNSEFHKLHLYEEYASLNIPERTPFRSRRYSLAIRMNVALHATLQNALADF